MTKEKIRMSAFICIYGTASVITLALYANYFATSVITNSSVITAGTMTLAVFVFTLFPLILKKIPRVPARAVHIVSRIWCACLWLYVISFGIFAVSIFSYDSSVGGVYSHIGEDESPVIITFGCKTNGMTPGKALTRRLELTKELLEHYPEAVTIVSGGKGRDESAAEADAMKKWLIDRGISEDRIYTEDRATSTVENIRYSLKVIEEKSLTGPLVGVSAYYHVPRIKLISERFGCDMRVAGNQHTDIQGMTREFMAYIWLFLSQGKINA